MKLGRLLQLALIVTAVLIMAASASASSITWSTNGAGTAFGGGGLVLHSGDTLATLTFTGNPSTITNPIPSNFNIGDFALVCSSCVSSSFAAFTINVQLIDFTDGSATGLFVGSSAGGTVTPTSSTLSISWTLTQLGPGTLNATGGTNFGTTFFSVPNLSLIVDPSSGAGGGGGAGVTTIQGSINSTAIPEPATMAMVGGLFVGLAALARKRRRS